MAIIIVAVIFVSIIAICGYVRNLTRKIREYECSFYDLYFLTKFLQEIDNQMEWKEYFKNNNTIYITRKVGLLTNSYKISEFFGNNVTFVDLYEDETLSVSESGDYFIGYEFKDCNGKRTFVSSMKLTHKSLLPYFNNSKFECAISSNRVKMDVKGFCEDIIYVSSSNSAYQSLAFVITTKEQRVKESLLNFLNDAAEIQETIDIIQRLKKEFAYLNKLTQMASRNVSMSIFDKRNKRK